MKRFTETEKWRDPWFRKLSPGAKLAFIYIVENCDNAGVWSADKELANFTIGMEIPWDRVLESFGDRIEILKNGDWLIRRFVEFQFGTLSESCKPHVQVLRLIEKHRVSKGYPKGMDTLMEKEKDKDKVGESAERGQKTERSKRDKATESEVFEFFQSEELPVSDAEWFFEKCQGNGWTNGGKPIRDWRATVRSWRAANYLPSQKNGSKPKGDGMFLTR